MTFGERLEQARKAQRISQERLGMGLGKDGSNMSKQAISHWEKGRNEPSIDQLLLICNRLRCSADWLILGKESPPTLSAEVSVLAATIDALPEPLRSQTVGVAVGYMKAMDDRIKGIPARVDVPQQEENAQPLYVRRN